MLFVFAPADDKPATSINDALAARTTFKAKSESRLSCEINPSEKC